MEIEKTELTPTLKINATRPTDIKFKKGLQASIRDVREIETTFGKKLLMGLDNNGVFMNIFLNAKTKNNLIDAFGTNTDNWTGNLLDLKKEIDEKFNKEMIVGYPLK